ncbi:MAG: hypothetical protein M3352_00260 [Bacteroidota bacterium]|jgi:hypothetical protein|nr:hypothetical protein [Bacteroidota bacterium]
MKKFYLSFLTVLIGAISFAQDAKLDVNVNTDKGSNWYASPWVWVVGGAVFILLLVALTRGGGRKA